jgi:hypothetical protein
VGDGTTSVTVLASELIREAEKLIDMRIHPQTIIAGWRKATQVEEGTNPTRRQIPSQSGATLALQPQLGESYCMKSLIYTTSESG